MNDWKNFIARHPDEHEVSSSLPPKDKVSRLFREMRKEWTESKPYTLRVNPNKPVSLDIHQVMTMMDSQPKKNPLFDTAELIIRIERTRFSQEDDLPMSWKSRALEKLTRLQLVVISPAREKTASHVIDSLYKMKRDSGGGKLDDTEEFCVTILLYTIYCHASSLDLNHPVR